MYSNRKQLVVTGLTINREKKKIWASLDFKTPTRKVWNFIKKLT